jgi:hypothetical protein
MVCLLLRPLYGLVQTGHIWYKLLASGYAELGYTESRADPCIRTRQNGNEYILTLTMSWECRLQRRRARGWWRSSHPSGT